MTILTSKIAFESPTARIHSRGLPHRLAVRTGAVHQRRRPRHGRPPLHPTHPRPRAPPGGASLPPPGPPLAARPLRPACAAFPAVEHLFLAYGLRLFETDQIAFRGTSRSRAEIKAVSVNLLAHIINNDCLDFPVRCAVLNYAFLFCSFAGSEPDSRRFPAPPPPRRLRNAPREPQRTNPFRQQQPPHHRLPLPLPRVSL